MKKRPVTITDDQIRALARGALTASQHQDCSVALGKPASVRLVAGQLSLVFATARERRLARARCAEIIRRH